MSAGIVKQVWWETAQRWYRAVLLQDLLEDWVVLRQWGGKGTKRYGEKTMLVNGAEEGLQILEEIHQNRLRRRPVYWRVYSTCEDSGLSV
jgi:hypothetical protein